MPWILDGNNILGQIPGRSRLDPSHRRELASRISRWCEARRCRASLYFDGAPLEGWRGAIHYGPLSVLHSGGGRSADEAILQAVASSRRPGDLRVVTSDRALSERCRRMGASTSPVREFRTLLNRSGGAAGAGSGKPDRVTPGEVARYLEIFGASEEPGKPRSRRRR